MSNKTSLLSAVFSAIVASPRVKILVLSGLDKVARLEDELSENV